MPVLALYLALVMSSPQDTVYEWRYCQACESMTYSETLGCETFDGPVIMFTEVDGEGVERTHQHDMGVRICYCRCSEGHEYEVRDYRNCWCGWSGEPITDEKRGCDETTLTSTGSWDYPRDR